MTWAFKRQISYISILVVFVLIFGYLLIRPSLNQASTCTDGVENGDETGVDCGGSCVKACIYQVDKLSILWSRVFKVVPGRYNAVAYLENKNNNVAINEINYRFRFADKNNVYIGKREGTTFIPPSGKFAIFEPAIDVGNSIPYFTTFEFTTPPNWIQVSTEKLNQLDLAVSNISLTGLDTEPALSAMVQNKSLFTIPEVGVVAILYDEHHNAISISRTYIDKLGGEEAHGVNFTWREPILEKVITTEIIPMFNVFLVKLK